MKRFTSLAFVVAILTGLALPTVALAQSSGGGGGGTTTPKPVPEHGEEIDMPIGGPLDNFEDPPDDPSEDDPPKLYDEEIPTKSESIIYVIDISGSMGWDSMPYTGLDGQQTSGPRIDRAKVELIRSIQSLSSEFEFNVLAYDCDIRRWSAGKQKAEPGPKASAISWVGALRPIGATGTGPATAAALQDKNNFTVVLLSDGAPNCGANDHLAMIQAANTQRAAIHAFGIACYGSFEQFMRDVASTSGGRYYAVP